MSQLNLPLIVFFISTSTLRRVLVAVLILCPLCRFVAAEWLLGLGARESVAAASVYRITFFQIDSLAAGALLATGCGGLFRRARVWFHLLLVVIVAVGTWNAYSIGTTYFGFGLESPEMMLDNYRHVYAYSLVNLCALMFIAATALDGPVYPFLIWNKVVYIGKISYGIYLIHLPVVLLVKYLFPGELMLAYPPLEFIALLVYFAVVFGLAHLSFHHFERRFLQLKKRFA